MQGIYAGGFAKLAVRNYMPGACPLGRVSKTVPGRYGLWTLVVLFHTDVSLFIAKGCRSRYSPRKRGLNEQF
ncbi:hypothetical protein GCM10022405_43920 [Gibbsiella dentisursi]|uniref:Uncharacterized protein n=1 Tax=Gibbsiella dentisursi TaxID=796890 RepID=A0ABP7M4J7_9GAMM